MDQTRRGAVYDLFIDPLRRDPNLTSLIVEGVKCTLGGILEEPFAVHDIAMALMEILDNIHRHTDWEAERRPTLHIWFEVMGDKPYFNILANNPVRTPKETSAKIQELAQQTRDRTIALTTIGKSLSKTPPLSAATQKSCGMGLLSIAALERCQMNIWLNGDIFEIQVALAVPEYSEAGAPR
jgi:hypothetical protein